MSEKLLLALLTAFVGGLSAWWAGRLGVRRALQQKKAERAFERRLDWYERATRAIIAHAAALHQVIVGAKNNFSDTEMSGLVDQMVAQHPALTAVMGEAQMYATLDSALLLAELLRTTQLLLEPTQRDPSDISEGFTLDVPRMEEAAALELTAASRLSGDVRSLIGLEPLQSKPGR